MTGDRTVAERAGAAAAATERPHAPLPAFSAVGIELEYMIVDRATLDVRPVADALLRALAGGADATDVERGSLGVSNELVQHVIEVKNARPAPDPGALVGGFGSLLGEIGAALAPLDAMLLPSGMHPWMRPGCETLVWPGPVYAAYDAIFDCHRHGYANLQSMHVNLPFAGDAEFARLHAALRLVLPLVPALAASSPVAEGRLTGWMDTRLVVYRDNARAFPAITGAVVPEAVASRSEYERRILAPMYRQIAPVDPHGRLRHEWLNSRGAIARFDRSAIEIRLADVQECPRADLAIAAALVAIARDLYERERPPAELATDRLAAILRETERHAERARVDDPAYLAALGLPVTRCTARAALARLLERTPLRAGFEREWVALLRRGTLARRIVRAVGEAPGRTTLRRVYAELAECLREGRMFRAE